MSKSHDQVDDCASCLGELMYEVGILSKKTASFNKSVKNLNSIIESLDRLEKATEGTRKSFMELKAKQSRKD